MASFVVGRREFGLLKIREVPEEQFWIIRIDVEALSLGGADTAVNADTARAQLRTLGCSDQEIEQLLYDARAAYNQRPGPFNV